MSKKDYVSKKFTKSILDFCKKTSKYKTPKIRTSGAEESGNQSRGEADWIDSVATIMLWRELASAGIPVTYYLTANGGDEPDLRVQYKGNDSYIDINVKGTKALIPNNNTPSQYGNVAIKQEELGLKLKKFDGSYEKQSQEVFIECIDGKFWAVTDKKIRLADIYIKVFVHEIPCEENDASAGVVYLTNWIYVGSNEFSERVDQFNRKMVDGKPEIIPGINHPGLWIPSNWTHRFPDFLLFLEKFVQENGFSSFKINNNK